MEGTDDRGVVDGAPDDRARELDRQLHDTWSAIAAQSRRTVDSLHERVTTVERRSEFAVVVPVASNVPGAGLFKRLVRKAVSWYVRFFVAQFQAFASAVAHALSAFEQELTRQRAMSDTLGPPVPSDVTAAMSSHEPWWDALAVDALRQAPGQVLHVGRRSDGLVHALRASSVDAVALEIPDGSASDDTGADLWAHHIAAHLALLPEHSLGGIVVEGPVQWTRPSGCDRLLSSARTRLAAGGIVLVASTTPSAWARSAPPVLVDLAPGHPLHPETWEYLMTRHGFGQVRVHRGGPTAAGAADAYVVSSVREP